MRFGLGGTLGLGVLGDDDLVGGLGGQGGRGRGAQVRLSLGRDQVCLGLGGSLGLGVLGDNEQVG